MVHACMYGRVDFSLPTICIVCAKGTEFVQSAKQILYFCLVFRP